ncbi:glycosyltransferase family 4 protein [uncultured Clostridium sp.]|uniref:glycosyltransferase family 4 protein n=1 Tax=uncultured Clostridium sp. TaxID=59620 RepID=UPI003217AD2A
MKILVVTQYFWPEEFRINDICAGLIEEGNEVEVLTGMPNYPKGKYLEGYSIKGPYSDIYKGMKIRRVPIVPRGKNSSILLMLNYLSFMVLATIRMIPLLFKRYDKVFMFETSPITAAVPAIVYSKIRKVPSYIYVQDVWPEVFYTVVPIKSEKMRKILKKVCTSIYNGFDKILISSKGFKEILCNTGLDPEKIIYFPQWAEDLYRTGVDKENNEDFTVTFAGNIGKAQSVDTIVKAANLCKENKHIKWNIVGDGSEFENIKGLVKEYGLEDTVILPGRRPIGEMPVCFGASDALIVTLRDEEILNATLPAKVQSYMASGKPIITSLNGEGSEVVEKSDCGLVGQAGDYKQLYKNVILLYNMCSEERRIMGDKGRAYFEENFTREKLLKKLIDIMK